MVGVGPLSSTLTPLSHSPHPRRRPLDVMPTNFDVEGLSDPDEDVMEMMMMDEEEKKRR